MSDLTETAAANLAAGATDGPGTDVCRSCTGPKEPTRRNSARCRACERGGAPVAAKPPTVVLKTSVERATYDAAAALARERGTTLAAVLRDGLLVWLGEVSEASDTGDFATREEVTPVPTPAQWLRVNTWLNDRPDLLAAYSGPRKKSALMAYARSHGYAG